MSEMAYRIMGIPIPKTEDIVLLLGSPFTFPLLVFLVLVLYYLFNYLFSKDDSQEQ